MTDEEYQRERNRLKQIRHRKRVKALAEGLDEDYYITDEDYIDRDAAQVSEQEQAGASEQAGEEQGTGAGVKWLIGAGVVFIGLIAYAWYNA